MLFVKKYWASPSGSVVKNLPAKAGDTSSVTDLGRCHMLQSNEAWVPRLLKLTCPRARAPHERSHRNEKPAHGS